MPRDVDIDALLAKGALRITIGGRTFEVVDVPLGTLLEIQQEQGAGAVDPRELLKRLVPGLDDETAAQMGVKAATIMLEAVNGFFTEGGTPTQPTEVAEGVGPMPSPDSSGISADTD